MLRIKRVYENANKDDGYRILVDRLWPRGVSKEKAHIHLWLKEIAPSDELRTWFNHKEDRWEEFKNRYKEELKNKKDLIQQIKNLEKKQKTITFVYGAKDPDHNQAVILLDTVTNF